MMSHPLLASRAAALFHRATALAFQKLQRLAPINSSAIALKSPSAISRRPFSHAGSPR
jgi:hypothetical protein